MSGKTLRALVVSSFVSLAGVSTASAQPPPMGPDHGPGIGVVQTLGGLTGGEFLYDLDRFHIEGIFGLSHTSGVDQTAFGIGGRFFFVIHRMDRSDFSLGGGLAIARADQNNAPAVTNIQIEFDAQIRVWLTANVALSAAAGFALVTADNGGLIFGSPVVFTSGNDDSFGIGGQLVGGLGLAYFFR
jgi:hypothetical protein